ncbi:ABC transporter ATP-binding protein [Thalassospira alkalitolerans]|uniref:ABC transporter ATP-binding protein n=1 Tax=Thalassospira alkalitolerans TaxID=1293890 RepID=UPI003AA849D2
MAAINIQKLSKDFSGFKALTELSLDVREGEFLTLLGPSGCGKTTLLKIISGFIEPTKGHILLNGKDVTKIPPEARDTALCFQSYALFPHLSVRENLEFGLRQKKVLALDRKDRIADVAEKLGLGPQMDKLPNQLSGGQQQRVSLGRALVMRPSVILFDEPLSNLDAKLRDQVRLEIRRIQKDYKLTAIYVTHDQAEALAMSDRIVVLKSGQIEQVDTPERLYAAPRTGFVADFIGNANVFTGRVLPQKTPTIWRIETPIGILETGNNAGTEGAEITLCWRAENAEINDDGALGGTVTSKAFQGHFTDLMVETKGVPYRIQTSRTDVNEGDTIGFNVPGQSVILLENAQ